MISRRSAVDLRLAIPAAAAWAVLAVAIGAPDALPASTLAVAVLAGVLLIALWRRPAVARHHPWITVVALACCASAMLLSTAAVRAPARAPGVMLEAASASRYLTASAVTTQTVFMGTSSFPVTITAVDIGDIHLDVSIPARAFGVASTA